MWTVDLPLQVQISKNKKFILNLNHYRNAHFHTTDPAKKNFKAIVGPLIRHIPFMDQVCITYTYFAPTQRLADVANVCSIVDKFFCDALVECHKLSDDNCKVVSEVRYRFGGVDRGNPRVEATIEPIGSLDVQTVCNPADHTPKETTLKIQLVQSEIEAAIRQSIHNQLSVREGHRIDIELRATRGDDGFIANIDIVPDTAPVNTTAASTSTASATTTEAAKPLGIAKAVKDTKATTAPVTETVSEPAADGVQEVDGSAPLKPSIFGNLGNKTEAAEAVEA